MKTFSVEVKRVQLRCPHCEDVILTAESIVGVAVHLHVAATDVTRNTGTAACPKCGVTSNVPFLYLGRLFR